VIKACLKSLVVIAVDGTSSGQKINDPPLFDDCAGNLVGRVYSITNFDGKSVSVQMALYVHQGGGIFQLCNPNVLKPLT
jgi:hypothetical protein